MCRQVVILLLHLSPTLWCHFLISILTPLRCDHLYHHPSFPMISSYDSLYTLLSGCMGQIIHWFIIPLPRHGYRCQTLLGTGNENINNNPWPPGAHSLVSKIPNYRNVTSNLKLSYTLPQGCRGGRLELSEPCVKGNKGIRQMGQAGERLKAEDTACIKAPGQKKRSPILCPLI